MKKELFTLIVIFLVQTLSFADSTYNSQKKTFADSTFTIKKPPPEKTTVWEDIRDDFVIFLEDWGAYLTSPLKMNFKGLVLSSVVIGGTVISSTADKEVRKAISRHGYTTYNHDFWDIPTAYGYVQYPSIFGAALYTAGLLTREIELRKTGRMLIQSLVYSGTLTIGLRYLLGRTRPFTSKTGSQYEFTWFQMAGDTQSFPAGHVVVAMATSTILAETINNWVARVLFYGMAGLTAYARLYNDKHWLSDVLFASALGYASAKFVMHQEEEREEELKKKPKNKSGGFKIYPSFNGINLTYNF